MALEFDRRVNVSQIISGVLLVGTALFAYTDIKQANAVQDVRIAQLEISDTVLKTDVTKAIDELKREVEKLNLKIDRLNK